MTDYIRSLLPLQLYMSVTVVLVNIITMYSAVSSNLAAL